MLDWFESATNVTAALVGWKWLMLHLAMTAVMVGVIWVIQLVHYPTFNWIDRSRFADFNRFHQRQITFIVGPAMLAEVATAVVLIFQMQLPWWGHALNIGSIVALWAITAFVAMPIHRQLLDSGQQSEWESLSRKLVATNWPRTLLWTARLGGWCWFVFK